MGLKDDVKLILFFQIGDHGINVFDFFTCFLLFFSVRLPKTNIEKAAHPKVTRYIKIPNIY